MHKAFTCKDPSRKSPDSSLFLPWSILVLAAKEAAFLHDSCSLGLISDYYFWADILDLPKPYRYWKKRTHSSPELKRLSLLFHSCLNCHDGYPPTTQRSFWDHVLISSLDCQAGAAAVQFSALGITKQHNWKGSLDLSSTSLKALKESRKPTWFIHW